MLRLVAAIAILCQIVASGFATTDADGVGRREAADRAAGCCGESADCCCTVPSGCPCCREAPPTRPAAPALPTAQPAKVGKAGLIPVGRAGLGLGIVCVRRGSVVACVRPVPAMSVSARLARVCRRVT